MSPDNDPTKWVDGWDLHGLSVIDRTRIKAILLKAHAAYCRADFKDPYKFIGPMQQAFDGIASILFDVRLLTIENLKNELRLFVIESAISGNWLYFAERDQTQGEIFPGHFGNVYVWKAFNGKLQMVFTAEIAEWTSELFDREAADAKSASALQAEHVLEVPKDSAATLEPKAKRGPKAKMQFHCAVARVLGSYGSNWKKHLDQIVRKLDKGKIPPLTGWAERKPPARSWERAWQHHPDVVLKALEYSLRMAAKNNPEKPSEILGNLR